MRNRNSTKSRNSTNSYNSSSHSKKPIPSALTTHRQAAVVVSTAGTAPEVQQPPSSISRHFTTFDIDSIVNNHQSNGTKAETEHLEIPTITAVPSVSTTRTPTTPGNVTTTAQLVRVLEARTRLRAVLPF
ncbi:unnamed protein product [Acanthoscelides obtectus]|uniref:Uncharacterized protein n=1 Tax=Acanthoscelides obtectus TaxID=200917 RepID=A0A9P0KNA6_ACAOB|nr:unnamed protein product [Acanthoscelides obtectus]CAK1682080.1 hypothetical protein AOBTE_LOCUS33414 [Acanthoscelides obtectus]